MECCEVLCECVLVLGSKVHCAYVLIWNMMLIRIIAMS